MGARVLVVADEENIAYVVSLALRLAGFEVATAATGREALRERELDPGRLAGAV